MSLPLLCTLALLKKGFFLNWMFFCEFYRCLQTARLHIFVCSHSGHFYSAGLLTVWDLISNGCDGWRAVRPRQSVSLIEVISSVSLSTPVIEFLLWVNSLRYMSARELRGRFNKDDPYLKWQFVTKLILGTRHWAKKRSAKDTPDACSVVT